MQIVEVRRDNKRDVRDFLQLPFRLYKDIPQWVPPLMDGERARFKPKFPFYEHSQAAFYLVRSGTGQAVGRIAVHNHRKFNEYRNEKNAILYLYEAVDDDQVAGMLFDAVRSWGQARGLDTLLGPKGFLTGDGIGLLVEGFEHKPAIGIAYNPAYYVRHWEAVAGMQKVMDYVSGKASRAGYEYPPKLKELAERVKQRRGFHVPEFKRMSEVKKYLPLLARAYNTTWTGLWAYTPTAEADLVALFDKLLILAKPELVKFVFKGDELIGFQLAYPDISDAIQRQKGELWPFGWIDMLLEKNRTKWINVNGNAVLPQYQGLGANVILYDEMAKSLLLNPQYEHADLVQVQETNIKMLGDMDDIVEMNFYKRHRVYSRLI